MHDAQASALHEHDPLLAVNMPTTRLDCMAASNSLVHHPGKHRHCWSNTQTIIWPCGSRKPCTPLPQL